MNDIKKDTATAEKQNETKNAPSFPVLRAAVIGALGKTGRVLSAALNESPDCRYVFGIDRNAPETYYPEAYYSDEQPSGINRNETNVPIFTSLAAFFNDTQENGKIPKRFLCDVLIDFSSRDGLAERLGFAKTYNLPLVLATTGFSASDQTRIDETAKTIPIFQAANLSLGANLLKTLCVFAQRALGQNFDTEIAEYHHREKKDAPSGTAMMIAEALRKAKETQCGTKIRFSYGRNGTNSSRNKNEIGIHSVRGGTIAGTHEAIFAGDDETIVIRHEAQSRKIFALGAIEAARFLIGKAAGKYGMEDLLHEKTGF